MLKYLRRHPVERLTIGGGIGKLSKLAQGAVDLHSSRTQVDLAGLARLAGVADIANAQTALQALEIAGEALALPVVARAREAVLRQLKGAEIKVDMVMVDRQGRIVARSD